MMLLLEEEVPYEVTVWAVNGASAGEQVKSVFFLEEGGNIKFPHITDMYKL